VKRGYSELILEEKDDLRWYCHKEHRTVSQILLDFPSVKIPLEYLLEVIPRIKPRAFSISSSMLVIPFTPLLPQQ
jgi:sulfite reductase alpha subunit-like flavoprotein